MKLATSHGRVAIRPLSSLLIWLRSVMMSAIMVPLLASAGEPGGPPGLGYAGRIVVPSFANAEDRGLFARIEDLRPDAAISAVGEPLGDMRGHGLMLKSVTGRTYFYLVLQAVAQQMKIESAEDAIAAVAYLGDQDPKMRYLALYTIWRETQLGESYTPQPEAESAVVWDRDAKNRVEWIQRITKALSEHIHAKQ